MKVQEMEQLVKQVTAFTLANSAERDSWEKAPLRPGCWPGATLML